MDNFDIKKFLIENKITAASQDVAKVKDSEKSSELSDKEQDIVDDILGSMNEGSLDENFDAVLDKVKRYAKKGLMTAAIVGSLLSSMNINAQQATQIKQAANITATTNTKQQANKLKDGKFTYKGTITSVYDKTSKYPVQINVEVEDGRARKIDVGTTETLKVDTYSDLDGVRRSTGQKDSVVNNRKAVTDFKVGRQTENDYFNYLVGTSDNGQLSTAFDRMYGKFTEPKMQISKDMSLLTIWDGTRTKPVCVLQLSSKYEAIDQGDYNYNTKMDSGEKAKIQDEKLTKKVQKDVADDFEALRVGTGYQDDNSYWWYKDAYKAGYRLNVDASVKNVKSQTSSNPKFGFVFSKDGKDFQMVKNSNTEKDRFTLNTSQDLKPL
jgi:hypothetical protein